MSTYEALSLMFAGIVATLTLISVIMKIVDFKTKK